ncbi:MAG TPA: ABC transporter ATP-binding protein [Thermodesulfobacteriota bacterium]|nr:ABC transporter ATP-binding protein [Thermodesulfobacteriota bacterium]
MPQVEIQDLRVAYGKAKILEGISMEVEPRELVSVIGPNGAGKTTLLRAISRVAESQGSIYFEGDRVDHLSPVEVVRRGIIHCPERRRLFPDLSVQANLEMGAFLRHKDKEGVQKDMGKMFNIFPILQERRTQDARTLSGGEQQMLAIARSLMSQPKFLMLDEPSMGLAVLVKRFLAETIKGIQKNGVTVLLVEQDADLAFSVADRVYVLEHGKVALQGLPDNLMKNPHVKEIYLGIA